MAVLDEITGLTVQIIVKKRQAQEYDNDEEEASPNTVTKYIEAQSGAKFGVKFRFSNEFDAKHSILADIYLDGKSAESHVYDKDRGRPERNRDHCINGVSECNEGSYFKRKFSFSQLKTGTHLRLE